MFKQNSYHASLRCELQIRKLTIKNVFISNVAHPMIQ